MSSIVLYASETDVPCARQLIDAFRAHGASVVGVIRTAEADVSTFGTVTGHWVEAASAPGGLLTIDEFAEKPSVEYARAHLVVDGLEAAEYLTLFGQYVLLPTIFDVLEQAIDGNLREQGEFQLTSALRRASRAI